MLNTIIHGKWEDWLPKVPDASVDMVLLDPPYNTTACEWDKQPVDLAALWKELKRIGKPNTAYVFTASQPFTTDLINSNRTWFKHHWIWDKVTAVGMQIAKVRPMMQHEDVIVFCKQKLNYVPQMIPRPKVEYSKIRGANKSKVSPIKHDDGKLKAYTTWYPKSIITFSNADHKNSLHPSEKPVSLWSYLIRTYSNSGDTVLDCFAGSFTTAEACIITGRNFITIEQDEKYCQIGRERIARLQMQPSFAEMVG